ncbi:MAG: SUMF1/EgtB/PvdO family nonheme iron enzyme [Myxococcales bacterium]|nr:SUMF1/EgtB/PvdO family nonheme iron enzyme [Myxococcales bacterium]
MQKRRPRAGSDNPTVATIVTEPREGESHEIKQAPSRLALPSRYVDLGVIGSGSFGEARRVRDVSLDRVLVLKLLHEDYIEDAQARWRFSAEARVTAALQHPGIVPVYDHGELADGRLWYAMKEVRGETLASILRDLHAGASPSGFEQTASGWTFRRVIEALARVAQTIAFAHKRGVIHRDLKPENLMVGEFGEVLVMDWGLARERLDSDGDAHTADAPARASSALTHVGDVLGTPAYMPPEQALGDRSAHGPHSDVYALGAILFHVLAGRAPYEGDARVVVSSIREGRAPSLVDHAGAPAIAEELRSTCERAMSRDPSARGTSAELANDLYAWLDGVRRREQALAALASAREAADAMNALREIAHRATSAARARWATLRPFDAIEAKRPAWALEAEAEAAGREAALAEANWLQRVHGVLSLDPELPAAHEALADHYRAALEAAERDRQPLDAARAEAMLRAHDRGQHAAFLRGEGVLSITTDPPGATVLLQRYEQHERRLVAVDVGVLGVTPLRDVRLERGSYRLLLRAEGRAEARYPVAIERAGRWQSAPPGEDEPWAIPLLARGELDDVYVPGSWAWLGGDPSAPDSLPRTRAWIDGFIVKRHPVTVREYLAFLDDLVATGLEDEALAAMPRLRKGHPTHVDAVVQYESGRFSATAGSGWTDSMPVTLIDWRAARRYARWYAARTNRAWRLPDEFEREKAARGVDGRHWPWGDLAEATFARVVEGQAAAPSPCSVDDHAGDESAYGVRGLAGNVRDWCAGVWTHEGPDVRGGRLRREHARDDDPEFRVLRGGAWGSSAYQGRAASRFGGRPDGAWQTVGCRLVRSVTDSSAT